MAINFDPWQFYGKPLKVHVQYEGGEIVSTGLDYSDAARAQVQTRCWGPGRWYINPEWTLDQEKVAHVIVAYLEQSAMVQNSADRTKPLRERFLLACEK